MPEHNVESSRTLGFSTILAVTLPGTEKTRGLHSEYSRCMLSCALWVREEGGSGEGGSEGKGGEEDHVSSS